MEDDITKFGGWFNKLWRMIKQTLDAEKQTSEADITNFRGLKNKPLRGIFGGK